MASKKQQREKRRDARLRQKMNKHKERQEIENLLDGDDDIQDEDEIIEQEDEDLEDEIIPGSDSEVPDEPVKKSYSEETAYMGPTSWEEADAMRQAEERAHHVRQAAWTAEELVRNIVYRPDMTPDQKGKAIAKVGDGFGERIKEVASGKMEKSLDIEFLEILAMNAIEQRSLSVTEWVGDWISKAVLSTRGRKKLSDEDFALVYEEDGNKVRKYPIQDKAHVRNALARAAQQIERGEKAAADARKALPKIRTAAKRMGIGMEKSNSVIIEKDASGQWRAVLWASNNFRDRDGEIITEGAHHEFVEWVNKNMDVSPLFMTWHVPGTARENSMDFVGYENGFLLMSCPLTEPEAARLLKTQTETDIGISIGGLALERDPQDWNAVTRYRIVEASDLPLERAANPFTEFEIKKEADVNTLEYLAKILGDEEKARLYIEKAGIKQAALRKAGVAEKEAKDETTPPENEQEDNQESPPVVLDEIIGRVAKEFGMEELSAQFALLKEKADKVDVLEALVQELVKSNEERLAEMIAPPAQKTFSWMEKRASQSDKTLLDEKDEKDKALKKAAPEYWLSEATATQPVIQ